MVITQQILKEKKLFTVKGLEEKLKTLPKYNKQYHIKYLLFIHNILYQQTYKKLEPGDFIPIQKNKMCKHLGNNPKIYYDIRTFLIENNIPLSNV